MPALRVENHGFQKKFRNAVLGYVFPNRAKERKQMAVSEPADALPGLAAGDFWYSRISGMVQQAYQPKPSRFRTICRSSPDNWELAEAVPAVWNQLSAQRNPAVPKRTSN